MAELSDFAGLEPVALFSIVTRKNMGGIYDKLE